MSQLHPAPRVPFEVIPAIDLSRGRCVRWIQGDPAEEEVFSADPVRVAQELVEQGARWLHVVDLDGARSGEPQHFGLVARMATAVPVPIQLGGGIRTAETVEAARQAGVARVLVGTAAADARTWLRLWDKFGPFLVPALDVRNGHLAVDGWQRPGASPTVLASRLAAQGVRLALCTAVARDGTLTGPDLGLLQQILDQGLPLLAAGGVGNVTHIAQLAALAPAGLRGVILGRALYRGRLTLAAAMAAATAAPASATAADTRLGEV